MVECSCLPGCELCDVCKTDASIHEVPDAFFDFSSSDADTGLYSSVPQTSWIKICTGVYMAEKKGVSPAIQTIIEQPEKYISISLDPS